MLWVRLHATKTYNSSNTNLSINNHSNLVDIRTWRFATLIFSLYNSESLKNKLHTIFKYTPKRKFAFKLINALFAIYYLTHNKSKTKKNVAQKNIFANVVVWNIFFFPICDCFKNLHNRPKSVFCYIIFWENKTMSDSLLNVCQKSNLTKVVTLIHTLYIFNLTEFVFPTYRILVRFFFLNLKQYLKTSCQNTIR